MQLREDYELEKQEAKENFNLQQQEKKTEAKDEAAQQREETDRRLKELKEATEERRQELKESYRQEVVEIGDALREQLDQIRLNHEERYQELVESRNKELEELGRSLQEEGKITEEGMEEIAGIIDSVYGEEGIGDNLIKGWHSRSNTEIGQMIMDTQEQLNELEGMMTDAVDHVISEWDRLREASKGGIEFNVGFGGGGDSGGAPTMQHLPMRQGGVGVVQGPAVFSVEPGQREAYMFAPLPAGGSSSLDVNMSGGFNVTGADVAGKAATEAALDRMVDEFSIAVRRMARRRGG
jgi:hypothetical protein